MIVQGFACAKERGGSTPMIVFGCTCAERGAVGGAPRRLLRRWRCGWSKPSQTWTAPPVWPRRRRGGPP
eukprot:6012832-Prymnesium_polylepis.1